MLISTKYEEIYPPTVKDFVYITDEAYTKEEVLEMESDILQTLDFDLQQTSQYRFLERYTKVMKCDSVSFYLAQYLLELGLLDSKMAKFLPSEQAAAAVLFAEKKLKRSSTQTQLSFLNEWQKMDKHSGYTFESLSPCFNVFESLVKSMNNSSLKSVYKKFKQGKYFEVARLASQVVGPTASSRAMASASSTKQGTTTGANSSITNTSQLSGSHAVNQSSQSASQTNSSVDQ